MISTIKYSTIVLTFSLQGLEGRRARVKELIRNIGVESKKRKVKKAKEKGMKAKKEEPVAKPLKVNIII
jgi:hypothetical protein